MQHACRQTGNAEEAAEEQFKDVGQERTEHRDKQGGSFSTTPTVAASELRGT